MNFITILGMPRKGRFQHRKEKEREKRARRHSNAQTQDSDSSRVSSTIDTETISTSNSCSTAEGGSLTPSQLPPVEASAQLRQLHSALVLPNRFWSDHSPDTLQKMLLCKVSCKTQPLMVTHSLTIHSNLSWLLFVNQHLIDSAVCGPLKSFSGPLTPENLSQLLVEVDRLSICAGQPDDHFVRMVQAKKGKILSCNGKVVAYVDSTQVEFNGNVYQRTVRTSECEVISNSTKCVVCTKYRTNLRAMYHRWKKQKSSSIVHTSNAESSSDTGIYKNERFMDTPEKIAKIASLRKRATSAEQALAKLRDKVRNLTQKQGEVLDHDLNSDLLHIMDENSDRVKDAYPEGSFAKLFWDEQLKAAKAGDPRQVRWHPVIIKWCLNMKLMSSSTYHALRSSGFVKLPSERTLRDYTHYFTNKPGFQDEVNQQLVDEVEKMAIPENRKYVVLLFDEMKVKEGLVYNKTSGEIIGFTDLGDINNQLLRLEQHEEDHPPIAKQLLAVMVRGMMFKLEFPYAHFGTCGVTGDMLYPIIWEAVRRLESSGLKVICVTADGASPNRKFIKLHYDPKDSSSFLHKTKNPYSEDDRWFFFIVDPPHLIKTVRNCWSHSGVCGTRRMKVNNKWHT